MPHSIPEHIYGDDGRYFWYHHYHTGADIIDGLNSNNLDKCLTVWASTAHIVADLVEKLPR